MNAVVKSEGGNALAAYGGRDPFAAAANEMGATDGVFLKFNGNTGDFVFGTDQEELPLDTQVAVDPASFARGWICWKESEVVDEVMVPVVEGAPPSESELEDHGPYETHADGTEDGWSSQSKAVFTDVQTGEVYTYKTTSKSGLRGIANLLKDFSRGFRTHPGQFPIVTLGNTSFIPKDNKKIGKKYAPVFKIVDWIDEAEVQALAEGAGGGSDDESNYAAEPAQQETKQAEAALAEAERTRAAAPAPQGRRGRNFG